MVPAEELFGAFELKHDLLVGLVRDYVPPFVVTPKVDFGADLELLHVFDQEAVRLIGRLIEFSPVDLIELVSEDFCQRGVVDCFGVVRLAGDGSLASLQQAGVADFGCLCQLPQADVLVLLEVDLQADGRGRIGRHGGLGVDFL